MQLELGGRVALEATPARAASRARLSAAWRSLWPPALATTLGFGVWEAVVSLGFYPDYVLPGPAAVLARLGSDVHDGDFWQGVLQTLERAGVGYTLAIAIGLLVGLVVARFAVARAAFGSLLSAVQTMPSIAWFPLAILLFRLSETAILFVVILGAAPSIANGLIGGIDHVPPLLVRSGRSIGAAGPALYRHVILPAALPSFLSGARQAWAFAWRSLMAGELLNQVAGHTGLGVRLNSTRELADSEGLLATMLVILVVGVLVDALFTFADRGIRRRRGLLEVS